MQLYRRRRSTGQQRVEKPARKHLRGEVLEMEDVGEEKINQGGEQWGES